MARHATIRAVLCALLTIPGALLAPTGGSLLATPDDHDPPYGVFGFKARPSDGSVMLSWTNSFDEDFAGVLICYDNALFPRNPTDGLPVPNGNDGRFQGLPLADTAFVHSGLTNSATYYYSAFAYDSSGNYSEPDTASATPRAMVRDFVAVAESLAISLTWHSPQDSGITGTFICYSTYDHPDRPNHGTPLPNGGWFYGSPGEQHRFRHQELTGGFTYYYSAFTRDSALNYSLPVCAEARVRYAAPPSLSLWVDYTKVPDQTVDLWLWADAFLDTAPVGVWVGGEMATRLQGDPFTWLWDPARTDLSDSMAVMASACDVDGNCGWMESRISAVSLSEDRPGLVRSAQRRIRVEFDAHAVSQDTRVAILPCRPPWEYDRWVRLTRSDQPTWTYLIVPQDTLKENSAYVIFSYGGTDLDSLGDPGGLIITLQDVGMIRSYTDTIAKTVSAQVSRLGLFTLSIGTGYPDQFVNPDMLEVSRACPNPFSDEVNLQLEIRASQRVRIAVYDALGRRVVGLADGGMRPGLHGITWDGANQWGEPARSGVYFLRIDNGVKSSTSKVILLR